MKARLAIGANVAVTQRDLLFTGPFVLYEEFRNGFAHLRGPKPSCAIAESHELDIPAWATVPCRASCGRPSSARSED
jgi:hypothetical protein